METKKRTLVQLLLLYITTLNKHKRETAAAANCGGKRTFLHKKFVSSPQCGNTAVTFRPYTVDNRNGNLPTGGSGRPSPLPFPLSQDTIPFSFRSGDLTDTAAP